MVATAKTSLLLSSDKSLIYLLKLFENSCFEMVRLLFVKVLNILKDKD